MTTPTITQQPGTTEETTRGTASSTPDTSMPETTHSSATDGGGLGPSVLVGVAIAAVLQVVVTGTIIVVIVVGVSLLKKRRKKQRLRTKVHKDSLSSKSEY